MHLSCANKGIDRTAIIHIFLTNDSYKNTESKRIIVNSLILHVQNKCISEYFLI